MKEPHVNWGLAFVLATIINANLHAHSGYTVTARGLDYTVLEKTTVENGTNRLHRYVELATGLNYTNSNGQLVGSSEQISILPTGGAAAVQGQHKVYFPANIYNGVIEVVTPDGRHLRSRPLGVSYDDGSNTVFIATLKDAPGYLTASNQVTYRDAFTGFKADLVCTYRRGGFESDLVFRQQPPSPGDYGLDDAFSTLQLVTEFFNTPDPQQIPAGYDDYYGLQDTTLKFGKLAMTHGKAFAFQGTNGLANLSTPNASSPVYKSWVHAEGRTFLIESVPVLDIAGNLDALPLTASGNLKQTESKILFATRGRHFPPARGVYNDPNQILLALGQFKNEPGVVLDYTEVNFGDSFTDYTFEPNTTYLVDWWAYFDGTTTFKSGAVIKIDGSPRMPVIEIGGAVNFDATPDQPVIFTCAGDNSVGENVADDYCDGGTYIQLDASPVVISNALFYGADTALTTSGDLTLWNCEFHQSYDAIEGAYGNITLENVLFSQTSFGMSLNSGIIQGEHVTFTGNNESFGCFARIWEASILNLTNSLICSPGYSRLNIPTNQPVIIHTNAVFVFSDQAGLFQAGNQAGYYLATSSPYRNAGTTNLNPDLLAEFQTMTTYAPQDGGWPDTNAPDLGYHYPLNEDSDHDGLPDWWEWKYFGNYNETATNLDASGNMLLYDYENGIKPNPTGLADIQTANDHLQGSNAVVHLVVQGQPAYIAILVDNDNLTNAIWSAYAGADVTVPLGSRQGWHDVWIGLRGASDTVNEAVWKWTRLYYDPMPPQITITSPASGTVKVPFLQLIGFCPKPLAEIHFNLTNSAGVLTNQPVFITRQYYDTNQLANTTNSFEAVDVPLTNGVNTLAICATDLAGNSTVTNLNFTLNYDTATNPVVNIYWPPDGTYVCCSNYAWRGWVDDPNATVMAKLADTNGNVSVFSGVVGRDGKFWVENLPVLPGTNLLALLVTNSAGHGLATNITLHSGSVALTIQPPPDDQLWQQGITVLGTTSDPDNYTVWVNGAKAILDGSNWTATNVYLPDGGPAVIQACVIPNSNNGGNGTGGSGGEQVSHDNLGNPNAQGCQIAELQLDRPAQVYVEYDHQDLAVKKNVYSDGLNDPPFSPYKAYWNEQYDYHHDWSATNGGSSLENYNYSNLIIDYYTGVLLGSSNANIAINTQWPLTGTGTQDPCPLCSSLDDLDPFFLKTDTTNGPIKAWEKCVLKEYLYAGLYEGAQWLINFNGQWSGSASPGSKLIGTETRKPLNRTAETHLHLRTGGKNGSTRQNLFCLTGWATAVTNLNSVIALVYRDGTNIPATQIKLGGLGYLGADGKLWKTLPDDKDLDVTPQTGVEDYTFNVEPPQKINLELRSVTFNGTDILQDNGNGSYPKPHWTNSDTGTAVQSSPVLYTANNYVDATAGFAVSGGGAFPIIVKGVVSGSLTSFNLWATNSPSGTNWFVDTLADAALAVSKVDFYNPMTIQWSYAAAQTNQPLQFLPAGTSTNQVYVSWKPPVADELYHTVVDVACRNAVGKTNETEIVAGVWSDFSGPLPGVKSWDGVEMRYWPDGWKTPMNFEVADLVRDKEGRCAAWEKIYCAALGVHAIGAQKLDVVPNVNQITPPSPPIGYTEPLGRFMAFVASSSHPGQGNNQTPVTWLDFYGGNNSSGLPIDWGDHATTLYATNTIYDPSYGVSFSSSSSLDAAKQAWEQASVVGFCWIWRNPTDNTIYRDYRTYSYVRNTLYPSGNLLIWSR